MTRPEQWPRIQVLLDELLDLSPTDGRRRLDALTGGDAALRPELERLLAADAASQAGPLDAGLGPLAEAVVDPDGTGTPAAGQRIGAYRVLRELGRGGMGEVLLAERAEGDFEQRVAIKIVRAGMNRAEIVERFRRERNILARLRHPNIASLHDGGTTGDGLPYFAMEYVDGERITDWCDARRLDVDARVDLFRSVCAAVQYAHRNLVVHRDLKPGNVFVTADGTVKLLDFGIGKLVDPDAADETQPTRGFLTPAFAAPEQIRGEATSTSSDVFSLGMLLYVLLTGQHPHGDTSRSVDVARAIAEDEPPEASSVAARDTATATAGEIAHRRDTTPGELRRRLKGDLDTVLGKALRKEPDERYASVQDFGEDLERHRRSLPVSARPATVRYRLRMFARRHRVGTVAGALLLVAIVGGVGGVLWQANVAAHERDRANAVKDYLIEVFSAADPAYESGEMLTAGELVERGAARVSSAFQDDPEIRAEITRVLGTVLMNLAQYERADEMLTLALEHHRRLDDPSGRYEALVGLGESAQWQGNLDAALDRYSEAGRLARHEFGAEDPRTLRALLVEASTLVEMGRADEAGQRFREAAARADRVLGVGTAEMASFHLARATYLHAIGDLEGVEREARAAAATYRRAGVGGLPLSRAYSALGRALGDLDRDDEGEEMLREAVAVLRAEYGDAGHPELAVALHNLAGPLMQGSLAEASGTGRLAEAEACMLEAIDVLERTVGPESWRVGEVLCSFSVVKTKQGDVAAAGELLAESIRITRAAFGDRHPAIAAPLSNLARNFLRQERYEDAAVAYEEAIAVARECFGERHLNVSHPLTGLADLCLETGRLAEAEAAAIEGWEIRRDALGARHSLVVETRVQIAGILEAADRGREALETLDGAVADARAGLPDTRTVLASALVARARQARELDAPGPRTDADLREALTIREREYGGDDARCGEIRDLLVSGPMR